MAAIPLLTKKGEDEESALKRLLGYAFMTVTVGLMALNVSGAWIGSNGNLFYTAAIAGAELFVALALGALIYTRNNLRFGVGIAVFLIGVYITLENGKMAVTHAMSDVFVGTPAELREQADLADKSAGTLETDEVAAKTDDKTSLTTLREEMASLRVESALMQSQSAEGITRAQTALKSLGMYRGPIDGIRESLTEGAMELRGEQIAKRMDVVQAQIDALTGLAAPTTPAAPVAPADTPSEAKRKEAILLRKHATEVEERTVWMNILLIGLEGIRSLALWVFLMEGTMSASRLKKRALEQLALAKVNVEIASINAEIAALQTPVPLAPVAPAEVAPSQSEPIAAVAPAEVAIETVTDAAPAQPEPETLDLVTPAPTEAALADSAPAEAIPETPVNQGARKGGKNAGLMKAAAKAARNRVLILADRSQEHVLKAAE